MPYYLIENIPVFLTRKKYSELREAVLKDKDAIWRTVSMIQGNKETDEKNNLMYEMLIKMHREDKAKFLLEWYSFDLINEEASQNIWDLLNDFSAYYGYSYLKDYRDFSDKLKDDHSGENYLYPMGKVFSFNHFVKPAKWWWKYRYRMKGRSIELLIDINKVRRMNGNLKDFYIQFNDSVVRFHSSAQVYFSKMPN